MKHREAWIQTFSGRKFTPLLPRVADVSIEDIAHALSQQCRFSGHTREFYSVAQHSLLVSQVAPSLLVGGSAEVDEEKGRVEALWGLLHDSAEAYLVDLPSPLKHDVRFAMFRETEEALEQAVCERFGLPWPAPACVKRADLLLLVAEARDLMSPLHPEWPREYHPDHAPALRDPIVPLPPEAARRAFLARFEELGGG